MFSCRCAACVHVHGQGRSRLAPSCVCAPPTEQLAIPVDGPARVRIRTVCGLLG